jgi:hypothetical protein
MTRQLFIGLYTEGSTDNRFLESVVKRTFENEALVVPGDFEILLQPIVINKKGLSFEEQVLLAAKEGLQKFGITVLCIHRDADNSDDTIVFQHSIHPALHELTKRSDEEYCKVITTIIPVQMIESWLLADIDLFKLEIGTNKSDSELGIHRNPELMADPKSVIKEAIRISRQHLVKRRRRDLTISEIYMPLGQKISIEKLNRLKSYKKFKNSVKKAFKALNYI